MTPTRDPKLDTWVTTGTSLTFARYQDGGLAHNKVKARRHANAPGRDTTEVPVMPSKSNPGSLRVRVSYTTEVPEWWRIQLRKRLGKQGLATRNECEAWLQEHGSSMDDTLRQEYDDWNFAQEKGETVGW